MTTITAAGTGGSWTTGSTWVGGVIPTAADDVVLDATSGNVTVSSGAVARSLDCTGYTGTLTHTAAVTLTLGDATAGAGNVALRLVSGMTYTLGNTSTSAITFASTSGTQQTITTGGKNLGNWSVTGAGSSYILSDSNSTGTSATVTLSAGTLNTGGQTCSWGGFAASGSTTRTLTLGSSTVSITSAIGWSIATATNMTLSAGTSTITFTAAGTINLGTNLSYNNISSTSSSIFTVTCSGGIGTGVIANLTRTGTAVKTDGMQINVNITISGTLTLTGNSITNRLNVESNVIGSPRTITCNGTVVVSNSDISDMVAGGSASWNLSGATGGTGDCGGCTGITFTTATTQTWQGTSGGNWSDVSKWTSRIPLPQDTVVISSAFTASQTITMDMPRLGGDISWTGSSGSPTWAITSTQSNIFGSLVLASGMSITGTGSAFRFRGRAACTITCNSVTFPGGITVDSGITGSYTLQDALVMSGALIVGSGVARGTLNTNGQTLTCTTATIGSAGVTSTVLTLGASTVNLTGTAAGALLTIAASMTVNAGTSNIVVSNASSNDRNIVAHGYSLATVTYTVAGSTGRLILGTTGSTGTITIGTLNFSDVTNARTLRLWAGTTLKILNTFNVVGTSGKLMTIDTSTGGTKSTLYKPYGYVSTDYLSVQDMTGSGTWYAGSHSTDSGNNTGITFTDAPVGLSDSGSFLAFF